MAISADIYVDSNANPNWPGAFPAIRGNVTSLASGQRLAIAYNHVEPGGAALSVSGPTGSSDVPPEIVSLDPADDSYRPMAGAGSISNTSNAISFGGHLVCRGLYIRPVGAWEAGGFRCSQKYFDCDIKSTGQLFRINTGNKGLVEYYDSQLGVTSSTTAMIECTGRQGARTYAKRCTFEGSSLIATRAIVRFGDEGQELILEDCDLSNAGAAHQIQLNNENCQLTIRNCKMPDAFDEESSISLNSNYAYDQSFVRLEQSFGGTLSGTALGLICLHTHYGRVFHDPDVSRVGQDLDGVPYSLRVETSAKASLLSPFETPPLVFAVGPGNTLVEVHLGHTAALSTTDQLGSVYQGPSQLATADYGRFIDDNRADPDDGSTPIPTGDPGSWTGAFGGIGSKFSHTINPTQNGLAELVLACNQPNLTFFIDPVPIVS